MSHILLNEEYGESYLIPKPDIKLNFDVENI